MLAGHSWEVPCAALHGTASRILQTLYLTPHFFYSILFSLYLSFIFFSVAKRDVLLPRALPLLLQVEF